MTDQLPEQYAAVLDFERQWWKFAGAKEAKIRDQFGCSSTRFYQLVDAAIDHPASEAYDVFLVRRLRRLRAARAHRRSGLVRMADTMADF